MSVESRFEIQSRFHHDGSSYLSGHDNAEKYLGKKIQVDLENANLHEQYLQSKFNQDVNMLVVPTYRDMMMLKIMC